MLKLCFAYVPPPVLPRPRTSGRRPPVRIRYYAEVYRRNKQAWPIMQKRCFPNDGNWNWISDGECGDGGDGGVEKNEGRESPQSPKSHPTPVPHCRGWRGLTGIDFRIVTAE